MTITNSIAQRGICEVLHFTTNSGLTGILAQEGIKCRNDLQHDQYIEHIYKQVCPSRRWDSAWHGHVNLSITRVNTRLFNIAQNNWHNGLDGFWCILAMNPDILTQDGVVFTTTNNIYPAVVRGTSLDGFERMFAPKVLGIYGTEIVRPSGQSLAEPTCVQAEVLFPSMVSSSAINTIYVREPEHADAVQGIITALSPNPISCVVNPQLFR